MSDLLHELVDNWDNPYWWADHELLAAILMTVVTGALAIPFCYLQGRAKAAGLSHA